MNTTSDDRNAIVDFVRRRWLSCLVAGVAAAGLGVGYAALAGKQSWTCTATLLYSRTTAGAPHYQQPEVQSISHLFKSRGVLEKLAAAGDPPMALKPLADSVTAEVVLGSGTINVALRAGDVQTAQSRLDKLLHIVIDQAAALRRATVEQILVGLDEHLTDARRTAERAHEALNRFHVEHDIVTSVEDDLERVHDDLAAVERAAETDRPALPSPEDAIARSRGATQDRLTRERDAIARESALALKRNEYDRAARLHAKRYISDAEFRRVATEYQALAAQHAQTLAAQDARLTELDRALVERLDPRAAGAINSAPLDDAAEAAFAARLQTFLAQRRAEAERLIGLRSEAARLQQTVTAAQDEVRRVSALIASYVELRDAPYTDLAIVQPAAPAVDPVSSNKKKLLVGATLGSFAVFLVPLFLWDFWRLRRGARPARSTSPEAAPSASLPVLATVATAAGDPLAARRDAVRTLALRIQQVAASRGVVVAVNALDEADSPAEAVAETAECLRRRGQRVLVVDALGDRTSARCFAERARLTADESDTGVADWTAPASEFGGVPVLAVIDRPRTTPARRTAAGLRLEADAGLAKLLLDRRRSADEVVLCGDAFDLLPAGRASQPDEAFASRRLTALFDELRTAYDVVLFAGPGPARAVDLELLAARVDALAFVGTAGRAPSAAGRRIVEQLAALDAPLLGAVYL